MKDFADLDIEYQAKLTKLVNYLFNTIPVIDKWPPNNPGTEKEDAETKVETYGDTYSLAMLLYERIPGKIVEIIKNYPQTSFKYLGWRERQFAVVTSNDEPEMIDHYINRVWELWRVDLTDSTAL